MSVRLLVHVSVCVCVCLQASIQKVLLVFPMMYAATCEWSTKQWCSLGSLGGATVVHSRMACF